MPVLGVRQSQAVIAETLQGRAGSYCRATWASACSGRKAQRRPEDGRGDRGRQTGHGKITRAVLRLLLQYAVETELWLDNPVTGLKAYQTGTRHTWTDDELAQFERRWPLGTGERLAFAAALHRTPGRRHCQNAPVGHGRRADPGDSAEDWRRAVHPSASRALLAAIKAAPAKGP